MASIKQNTRPDLQRSKMEVSKAKFGVGRVRIQASSGRTAFSFYSENEAADIVSRKSMPLNKASTLASTSSRKGVQKSTEMSKGKNGSCAFVGRRALADVSNVQGNVSRNLPRTSLKLSVSTSLLGKTTNVSSRKSIQGDHSQGVPDLYNSNKDFKVPSNSQNTKATRFPRESIVANKRMTSRNSLIPKRMTTRNSLIPTRKSLPVLKRVNQADIPKENLGSSEKAKGEIKVAVGRKAMPRVNNAKTHPWRNRVSDGFMITGKRTVDSRTVSRKSTGPIVKTTIKASCAKLNTKPNPKTGMNKSVTAITTLSKNKEPEASSHCENITQESICAQLPLDGNSKPSTSDTLTKKSSRRRRSYTSLLVEGSKLLEEHDMKQEKLLSIDDEANQLEVVDYVDDIYQYYWVTEAQNPALANCMSVQTDISPHMRAVLINWLIEVHFKFDLMQETLYLMVTLLDRYLSQVTIQKSEMQLVGLTALLLASKYEDFWHPRVQDLLSISAESYTRDQMLEMEKLILRKLKFRLNTPTPYVFMLRFLKAAQSDTKLEHLAFYLIELCLVEYEALMFKPSLLCASAIFVARCTLQMTPWTPLLCRHARYEVSQLRDCAEMILRFQRAARAGQLKVTYDKYMSPDLSGVAAIKPLDRLPL
ncbi:putative cyclin-B3-1 isoform X2 [Morus notabilis]|uniref:putative cyclin-B3-1 isoform X2 n=1 Tax=Morus notabilis TaxID=981085 RepID=UPI000CED7E15|nr:putative cyclin-B3-1 isoform X2 [Morus notabilis]